MRNVVRVPTATVKVNDTFLGDARGAIRDGFSSVLVPDKRSIGTDLRVAGEPHRFRAGAGQKEMSMQCKTSVLGDLIAFELSG